MARTPKTDLDVLALMIQPKWRGIEFHCGPWSMEGDHDIAEHKFPDRPAGLMEHTGRNPMRFSFTAYFRNGISGSGTSSLPEYPDNWRQFIAACSDGTTGDLVHPELGPIKVKCKSHKTTCEPGKRDGVDVEVSFVESPAAEAELDALLKQPSPMGTAIASARDLDDATGDIDPIPEYPESISPSLLESMKQLQGAFQQFKLGIGNLTGTLDAYLGGMLELRDTLIANGNPATTVKAILALDKVIDALLQLSQESASKNRPITQAVVQSTTSADIVAGFFATPVDAFLKLNPLAADGPTIAAGSSVFVYA